MPARPLSTHRVTGFFPARTVLRARTLRQALYDEGDALMADVIVNLHGADHLARRRLENRLFRRDTFDFYETRRLPQILDETLQPAIERGLGDLAPLARRTMMALSIDVAGVDVGLHPTLDTVGA
ncbi:MAG: cytochrome P450, partial [Acidimicrobiia bacterium]|nr:cytochrome P450 [Acidimicrobiia bacterium]